MSVQATGAGLAAGGAPSLPHNQVPSEPELRDLLDLFKREIALSFNCHAVATIQTFNPLTQQATATINYKKAYSQYSDAAGTYTQTAVDYPQVVEAPVFFLGGGAGRLTFPVAPGDECMVLFNDRDFDNWLQGSQGAVPASTRTHAFADAAVLVGLRSLPNALAAFDSSRTVLAQGSNARVAVDGDFAYLEYGPPLGLAPVQVKVGTAGVTIKNATGTLGSLLGQLTTQLTALCTQVVSLAGTVGATPVGTAVGTISTSIGTIATQIAGLLP